MSEGLQRLPWQWLKEVPVQRIALLLNIFLVIFLSYTLADLSWRLIAPPSPVAVVTLGLGAAEQGAGLPSLSDIAELHLFGEAGKEAPVVMEQPVDAPETSLDLKLKGVFAVEQPDSAMAIIATSGRDELSYHVGQNVAGAAIVHQILADRVILKRGSRFETLMLPKEMLGEQSGQQRSAPTRNNNRLRSSPGNVRSLPGLRDRIMGNPQDALSMINARPVMEGDSLKGYRVMPGKERALFSRAGLRPNDVVTEVNGISLSDSSQLGTLMQQFNSSPRVQVTLERGGRPMTLTLDLQ